MIDAIIDDFGPRAALDQRAVRELYEKRLLELGEVRFEDIEVCPFEIKRFGVSFGLIPRPPDGPDDDWWAIAMPGDVMAFHPPWDDDYDT